MAGPFPQGCLDSGRKHGRCLRYEMLGRGGQGAYMSAEMLAAALVKAGKYATAFLCLGGAARGSG